MSDLPLFLKESRHIFSVCPECLAVHRLSQLQLSSKGRYKPDWMDEIEQEMGKLSGRMEKLEERAREFRMQAKERAERTELPRLLNRVAPVFVKQRIDPRDVRTLFHPVEFVIFEGMNSESGVRGVTFIQIGGPSAISRSIEKAIDGGNYGWNTLKIADDGRVAGSSGTVSPTGPQR